MPVFQSYVLDNGLAAFAEADRIYICYDEPINYTEATNTYSVGYKEFALGGAFSAPMDDYDHGGRKVTSTAFNNGFCTANGTALFWAATDTANTRLLATGSLATYQAVGVGEAFSLPAFSIGQPASSE